MWLAREMCTKEWFGWLVLVQSLHIWQSKKCLPVQMTCLLQWQSWHKTKKAWKKVTNFGLFFFYFWNEKKKASKLIMASTAHKEQVDTKVIWIMFSLSLWLLKIIWFFSLFVSGLAMFDIIFFYFSIIDSFFFIIFPVKNKHQVWQSKMSTTHNNYLIHLHNILSKFSNIILSFFT